MKHCFAILSFCFLFDFMPVFGQSGGVKLLTSEARIEFNTTPPTGDSTCNIYDSLNRVVTQNIYALSSFGTWYLAYRNIDMEYDSFGNLLGRTFQQRSSSGGGMWVDLIIEVNTYDSVGHKLSYVETYWNGSVWEPNGNQYWTYDASGKLLTWTIDGQIRYLYEYDGNGLVSIETRQTKTNGAWDNYSRNVFFYSPQSGSQPSEIRVQYLNGSDWFNFRRYTYSYDGNGNQLSETLQQYGALAFINESKLSYGYNSNNRRIYFLRAYWENGAWEDYYQEISKYDLASDLQSIRGELWSSNSNTWKFYSINRYYYTEFVSTQIPYPIAFDVFPNPASTAITLKGERFTHVRFFDSLGKLVYSQGCQDSAEQTLQLGHLPAGNYLLQVMDRSGKTGTKPLQIRR